jgi:hypothetical protein
VPDLVTTKDVALVPAEDPRSLAAAVRSVLADPEAARQKTVAAHQRIAEMHGPEQWIDRHEALYQWALAQ